MSGPQLIAIALHGATCVEPWDACAWNSLEDPDLNDCRDENGDWRLTGLEDSLLAVSLLVVLEDALGEQAQDKDLAEFAKDYAVLEDGLRQRLYTRIRKERASKVSYAAIGKAFGVSRQAAWERFSKVVDHESGR